MDKKIYTLLLVVCLTLPTIAVQAKEFKQVYLPDDVLLEGTTERISLNGVGMRSKFFFDIYVGALYLPSAVKTRDDVLSLKGPKRVFMHFVYDEVSAEKLVSGWNSGFEENLSAGQLSELAEQIKTFNAMFDSTMHAGDEVLIDYLPAQGTRVTIKGEEKGVIAGDDFNYALLNIWLGDEPADEDLKEAILNAED